MRTLVLSYSSCLLRRQLVPTAMSCLRFYPGDEIGRGAGKGGGYGGTVREAGGTFGKLEAVREEEYFRKLAAQQLRDLKQKLEEEMTHHEEEIKRLEAAVERRKKRVSSLKENIADVKEEL